MQKLSEIRQLLAAAGVGPKRGLGQNFLIDANLMGKLLELAAPAGNETILEVGAATGSLTEELLDRAGRVLAVELDATLAAILRRRLGARAGLTVVEGDVLAGKRVIAPAVLEAVGPGATAHHVANLPYNVAVPVILNCLLGSWRALRRPGPGAVRFDRLTFTVQRELAERLTAGAGLPAEGRDPGGEYGPAAVTVALLARVTEGRPLPPQAFWPRPKVLSRMLRLDFDADSAARLADADTLSRVLAATFRHRRKKVSTTSRTKGFPYRPEVFLDALAEAGVDPSRRPQQIRPAGFRALANALWKRQNAEDVVQ